MKKNTEKRSLGLYLHIPFCRSKCAYCDFCSFADADEALMNEYTEALCLDMQDYSRSADVYRVDTVFIGGGTPTALPIKNLLKIIDSVYENFDVAEDAEFTIEVNPATVDEKELKKLNRAGVNRISIGLQSAHNSELKTLSRIHKREDFEAAFYAARDAGFENINIDIMYGLPGQNLTSFASTLEYVTSFKPEHISAYNLRIEPNTPFGRDASIAERLPDEETQYEMYMTMAEYFKSQGYQQYEISNFSLPGRRCQHNLKYWHCQEYLGLGVAAHSYYGGKRIAYTDDINKYIDEMMEPGSISDIFAEEEVISVKAAQTEYIMLAMRLYEGVNPVKFEKHFGVSFDQKYLPRMQRYIDAGFIVRRGEGYAFSVKGMFVSSYILSDILDF